MTRTRFHIGAQKTATTHLQMTLRRCELAPGTRYMPLKRLRRLLTSRVRKGRAIRERFPVSDANPRFDPWTEAQKRALAELDAEDLAALQGRVEVWQPPAW